MKKNYIKPEAESALLKLETSFLTASERVGTSGTNLVVTDVDDDDFWN